VIRAKALVGKVREMLVVDGAEIVSRKAWWALAVRGVARLLPGRDDHGGQYRGCAGCAISDKCSEW